MPLRRPPLTVVQILAWADAHRARTGRWPKRDSGPVKEGHLGDSWRKIDNALVYGLRGLEPGSTLARLLEAHRGVRNVKALPPLTERRILSWADAHRARTGAWPNENSGPIPEAPGEVWVNVNSALREGHRGLPGGSSLARLLAGPRGARTRQRAMPHRG